jgi:integrase
MLMERSGATAWTRRMAGAVLTNALRHAVRLKLIAFNPAADVVKARPEEKEMRFFSEAQTKQFLDAAKSCRLFALFALAVGSGMRQGELLGLQWADINFDKGTVSVQRSLAQVGKGFIVKEPESRRSRRIIKLPRFVLDALHEHRKRMVVEGKATAPVFCTRTGQYSRSSRVPMKKPSNLPRSTMQSRPCCQ